MIASIEQSHLLPLNLALATAPDGIARHLTLAEPGTFSLPAIAFILALVIVSGALFFWRFFRILRTIFRSRKDRDFSIRPVGRRVWDFLWEVLCQAKVIRQRPLPGLAHAFVFWGFLAFALVTLNHLASGVHFAFLKPQSAVSSFSFGFAAVWALLVAVSIASLFVRRFFFRPASLGAKISYESGFIAFLIFTLMATYLAAFFVADGGVAVDLLWWTHTLALLIFLPLIPHTKHLHLILSPVTVFLKRDGFSKIPPLDGDEDFGLVAGKDMTQILSLQAYSCVECGRCTEHCPASATGKVLNMSMEAAFACTTCGSCEFQCPVGIQHLPIIVGLRRGATNTGAWEDGHGTKLFLALEAADLILTGRQSDDLGFGQTGVVLAELLGIAHATIILQVERTEGGLKVRRELEDGWFQHVEMPLPALLTIQSGGNKLRYATLMGIKKAKYKPLDQVSAIYASRNSILLERVYLPEKQKRTQMLVGEPSEIDAQLVQKLKFDARVL